MLAYDLLFFRTVSLDFSILCLELIEYGVLLKNTICRLNVLWKLKMSALKYYSPLVHSQKEWSLTMYVYTGGWGEHTVLARVIGKVSEWEADRRIDGRGPRTWHCPARVRHVEPGRRRCRSRSRRISSAPCSSSLFHVEVALSHDTLMKMNAAPLSSPP